MDDTKKVSSNNNDENQEQNNGFGRFDDVDDTLHDMEENSIQKEDDAAANNESLYECYYCDNFAPTTDGPKYQKHVLSSHPQKRLYPSLSELKEMGIKPKGKRWGK